MTTDVLILEPRPDDAGAWVRVHQASWRWSYEHLFPVEFFEERESRAPQAVEWWEREFAGPVCPGQASSRLGSGGQGTMRGREARLTEAQDSPAENHRDQRTFTYRLAERNGEVCGIGAVVREPGEPGVELSMLYVLPQRARSGMGSALLDALVGNVPARLWVFQDNPRARPFYEARGFRPDGGTQVVLGHPAIRMTRP